MITPFCCCVFLKPRKTFLSCCGIGQPKMTAYLFGSLLTQIKKGGIHSALFGYSACKRIFAVSDSLILLALVYGRTYCPKEVCTGIRHPS